MNDSDAQRFWANVDVSLPGWACWLWRGGTMGDRGRYGRYGRCELAHRVAYDLSHDEPAGDRWVGRVCGSLLCCNPHHLVCGPPRVVLAACPNLAATKN